MRVWVRTCPCIRYMRYNKHEHAHICRCTRTSLSNTPHCKIHTHTHSRLHAHTHAHHTPRSTRDARKHACTQVIAHLHEEHDGVARQQELDAPHDVNSLASSRRRRSRCGECRRCRCPQAICHHLSHLGRERRCIGAFQGVHHMPVLRAAGVGWVASEEGGGGTSVRGR